VYSKKIFGKIFDLFPKLDPCFEMGVKIKKRIFGKFLYLLKYEKNN